jgi:hypothetical protein
MHQLSPVRKGGCRKCLILFEMWIADRNGGVGEQLRDLADESQTPPA